MCLSLPGLQGVCGRPEHLAQNRAEEHRRPEVATGGSEDEVNKRLPRVLLVLRL